MVSFSRARAESLELQAKIGFLQRPERFVLFGLGSIFLLNAFIFTIWLVAFLANYTALQRIRFAYKQDSAEFKEEITIKT